MTAARDEQIRRLYRARPRDRALRASAGLLAAVAVASFASGTFDLGDLLSERRLRNLRSFLAELVPQPIRSGELSGLDGALSFYVDLLAGGGATALGLTVAIAVAASGLAAVLGAVAAPLAARNLATAEPFLPAARPPAWLVRAGWTAFAAALRAGLVFLRAVPEYVWAFLLVTIFGPGAWPAVLALGIHNAGILGRLGGEVLENVEPPPARALRAIGASRRQLLLGALAPAAFPRGLAFHFYRFETCVREATILGTLGILSLGYVVAESRAGMRYDEMIFFVGLGALVVQVADAVSSWARRSIRGGGE